MIVWVLAAVLQGCVGQSVYSAGSTVEAHGPLARQYLDSLRSSGQSLGQSFFNARAFSSQTFQNSNYYNAPNQNYQNGAAPLEPNAQKDGVPKDANPQGQPDSQEVTQKQVTLESINEEQEMTQETKPQPELPSQEVNSQQEGALEEHTSQKEENSQETKPQDQGLASGGETDQKPKSFFPVIPQDHASFISRTFRPGLNTVPYFQSSTSTPLLRTNPLFHTNPLLRSNPLLRTNSLLRTNPLYHSSFAVQSPQAVTVAPVPVTTYSAQPVFGQRLVVPNAVTARLNPVVVPTATVPTVAKVPIVRYSASYPAFGQRLVVAPRVATDKLQVRRPAIQKQFYDIEERTIIRPVGSAVLELEEPLSKNIVSTNEKETAGYYIAAKHPKQYLPQGSSYPFVQYSPFQLPVQYYPSLIQQVPASQQIPPNYLPQRPRPPPFTQQPQKPQVPISNPVEESAPAPQLPEKPGNSNPSSSPTDTNIPNENVIANDEFDPSDTVVINNPDFDIFTNRALNIFSGGSEQDLALDTAETEATEIKDEAQKDIPQKESGTESPKEITTEKIQSEPKTETPSTTTESQSLTKHNTEATEPPQNESDVKTTLTDSQAEISTTEKTTDTSETNNEVVTPKSESDTETPIGNTVTETETTETETEISLNEAESRANRQVFGILDNQGNSPFNNRVFVDFQGRHLLRQFFIPESSSRRLFQFQPQAPLYQQSSENSGGDIRSSNTTEPTTANSTSSTEKIEGVPQNTPLLRQKGNGFNVAVIPSAASSVYPSVGQIPSVRNLSPQEAQQNQQRLIELLTGRGEVSEVILSRAGRVGLSADGDSGLIRGRVLSVTSATPTQQPQEVVSTRRVVVSRPIQTLEEVDVPRRTASPTLYRTISRVPLVHPTVVTPLPLIYQ